MVYILYDILKSNQQNIQSKHENKQNILGTLLAYLNKLKYLFLESYILQGESIPKLKESIKLRIKDTLNKNILTIKELNIRRKKNSKILKSNDFENLSRNKSEILKDLNALSPKNPKKIFSFNLEGILEKQSNKQVTKPNLTTSVRLISSHSEYIKDNLEGIIKRIKNPIHSKSEKNVLHPSLQSNDSTFNMELPKLKLKGKPDSYSTCLRNKEGNETKISMFDDKIKLPKLTKLSIFDNIIKKKYYSQKVSTEPNLESQLKISRILEKQEIKFKIIESKKQETRVAKINLQNILNYSKNIKVPFNPKEKSKEKLNFYFFNGSSLSEKVNSKSMKQFDLKSQKLF